MATGLGSRLWSSNFCYSFGWTLLAQIVTLCVALQCNVDLPACVQNLD